MHFEENTALKIVLQVCSAVNYLHSKNIIHRDIKASNLLFDDEANTWLCDFGFARMNDEDNKTRLGTP